MYQYLHQEMAPFCGTIGQSEPDVMLLDAMVECVIRSRFSNIGSINMLSTLLVDKLAAYLDMPVNLDFPYGFEIDRYYLIQDLAKHLGGDAGLRRLRHALIPDWFYDEQNGMGLILYNHGHCIWTIVGNRHFTF